MKKRLKSKKRPCRICRKWFIPDPRVGKRQMTCGAQACKDKWHAKKCSEWNSKNQVYFREIYLSKKLSLLIVNADATPPPSKNVHTSQSGFSGPKLSKNSKLPVKVIQEVIDPQTFEIIKYMIQLLQKPFQEVLRRQHLEITSKIEQLPLGGISRLDIPQHVP